MAEDRARVFAFVGESRRERVVFDGTEADAREYLERRFPRPHIEAGTDYGDDGPPVDAVLDVAGKREQFDGRTWAEWSPPTNLPTWTKPDERDALIEQLQAQIAAANAQPTAPAPAELSDEEKQIADLERQLKAKADRARIAALQRELNDEPTPSAPPVESAPLAESAPPTETGTVEPTV